MADYEYVKEKGFGHTKYHVNSQILQKLQEKATNDYDFEFLDILIEMELNQGVDTRHIRYKERVAIYMSHNGYTPTLTSENSEKLFTGLAELYGY